MPVSVKDFVSEIRDAVSAYPHRVEWFEDDEKLMAHVRGDTNVQPDRVEVYNTLRIGHDVIELYKAGEITELREECQRIAEQYDCNFDIDDKGDWRITKPLPKQES